ncbi:5E5 antigen-like [Ananas comosus]|uniref:5E5 antigen-like n=1 Tax=Ananas comosus TaxID=4615 RepID=A0A6P5FLH0_ANACO|nr:5E5 antigen-like [Ananas comosus]
MAGIGLGTTSGGSQMPEEEKGGGERQQRQPTARALPLELGSVADLGRRRPGFWARRRPARAAATGRESRWNTGDGRGERPQVLRRGREGAQRLQPSSRWGGSAGRCGGAAPAGAAGDLREAAETRGRGGGRSCGGVRGDGRGLDSAWARAGKLQDAGTAGAQRRRSGGSRAAAIGREGRRGVGATSTRCLETINLAQAPTRKKKEMERDGKAECGAAAAAAGRTWSAATGRRAARARKARGRLGLAGSG